MGQKEQIKLFEQKKSAQCLGRRERGMVLLGD